MAVTPPNPGIAPKFLTEMKGCTFVPSLSALLGPNGAPKTIVLTQGSAGGSSVEWAVSDATSTCPTCQIDRLTFDVLTQGEEVKTCGLLYRGQRYLVIASASGSSVLCAAVPA